METKTKVREKVREIKVSHGMRREIMAIFGASYPTVRAALRFKSDTYFAKRMRGYALNHGGVIVESINQ